MSNFFVKNRTVDTYLLVSFLYRSDLFIYVYVCKSLTLKIPCKQCNLQQIKEAL